MKNWLDLACARTTKGPRRGQISVGLQMTYGLKRYDRCMRKAWTLVSDYSAYYGSPSIY